MVSNCAGDTARLATYKICSQIGSAASRKAGRKELQAVVDECLINTLDMYNRAVTASNAYTTAQYATKTAKEQMWSSKSATAAATVSVARSKEQDSDCSHYKAVWLNHR